METIFFNHGWQHSLIPGERALPKLASWQILLPNLGRSRSRADLAEATGH